MTSHDGKNPSRDHFWASNVYLSTDYLNFVALFKTSRMQKHDKIKLWWRAVSKGWCKKSSFKYIDKYKFVFFPTAVLSGTHLGALLGKPTTVANFNISFTFYEV